jgi:hypothetical protein
MSPILKVLAETLQSYLEAVKKAGDPTVDLHAHFQKLEVLAKTLPPGTNPQLRHYLQQKSYRKAHDLLQGGDPEAGACGR